MQKRGVVDLLGDSTHPRDTLCLAAGLTPNCALTLALRCALPMTLGTQGLVTEPRRGAVWLRHPPYHLDLKPSKRTR